MNTKFNTTVILLLVAILTATLVPQFYSAPQEQVTVVNNHYYDSQGEETEVFSYGLLSETETTELDLERNEEKTFLLDLENAAAITVSSSGNNDVVIVILDENLDFLKEIDNFWESDESVNLTAGTYYLVVSEYDGNPADFTITVITPNQDNAEEEIETYRSINLNPREESSIFFTPKSGIEFEFSVEEVEEFEINIDTDLSLEVSIYEKMGDEWELSKTSNEEVSWFFGLLGKGGNYKVTIYNDSNTEGEVIISLPTTVAEYGTLRSGETSVADSGYAGFTANLYETMEFTFSSESEFIIYIFDEDNNRTIQNYYSENNDIVTGTLTLEKGSYRVWVEEIHHNEMNFSVTVHSRH